MQMTATALDLMTGHILRAHASWPVSRLAEFLTEHAISGAPVVSEEGHLIGVVSTTDIVRGAGAAARREQAAHTHDYYLQGPAFAYSLPRWHAEQASTVRDIMTPTVFDVPVNATAQEIAETMLRGHIHRVFVTESGMVIGVITVFDVLRALL
jgi:CBS domain-containing protein